MHVCMYVADGADADDYCGAVRHLLAASARVHAARRLPASVARRHSRGIRVLRRALARHVQQLHEPYHLRLSQRVLPGALELNTLVI